MATTQPIRDKKQVKALLNHFARLNQNRNHLMASLMIHTALRVSDILSITWGDVYDFENKRIRKQITIKEGKTKKYKTIALHKNILKSLNGYLSSKQTPNTALMLNPKTGKAITRTQAYRIISNAAKEVGIEHNVSPHSLRKTFGYLAWKSNASPTIIMEIYNHTNMATTKRYLGVSQDDKNEVYLGLSLNTNIPSNG